MNSEISHTVQSLRSLRKGESIAFYKGDFPPRENGNETPLYDALLRSVFLEAKLLENEGAISIRESLVEIPLPPGKCKGSAKPTVLVNQYTATGMV